MTVKPQLSDATTLDALMYVWHERCESTFNTPVLLACRCCYITLHASVAYVVLVPEHARSLLNLLHGAF